MVDQVTERSGGGQHAVGDCPASRALDGNGECDAVERVEAEHAARRLPGTTGGTGNAQFSETTVAVYRIGVHTALGDSAKALSYFTSVVPGRLPTAERRARSYVDGARAWKDHGNLDQASSALNMAFTCAPQELQRPSVRDLITTMLDAPGRTPAALLALAAHAGL
ncbi:hypothetical protein P3102_10530 [Amycolatopsis sp. QT-25]|uniref:hypothetical protein n=1 Tax=Amycolatopsis sp. QT-25 TaxID=3034022 RepID=UPI0023ECA9DE|nr:hypothetical protein [Amycolatopsis sp. QT-25]WET81610.1 hypothetical protein P3102_10530 [Amycolatopsis sp. QT-25]